MGTYRDILKQKFRDYLNNYLTVEKFAESNGISPDQAITLLNMGRELHDADAEGTE